MIGPSKVMLHNLILSLSDVLDLVHPCAVDHQQRVAYTSLRLAKTMGYSGQEQANLMYATVLHDIGILSVEEKIDSMQVEINDWQSHSDLGAKLLQRLELFSEASELVKWHHLPWSDSDNGQQINQDVRISANIIHLADTIDRLIRKDEGILGQVNSICEKISKFSGIEFFSDIVSCFHDLSKIESFWLELNSSRIYPLLTDLIIWPYIQVDTDSMEQIGKLFSKIVDYRSVFTATHSTRVATAAEELAKRYDFKENECRMMRTAGYLHDLGKVSVPKSILEKPGKLNTAEFNIMKGHTYYTNYILSTITGFEQITKWASYHHERLNGKGYPFHLKGEILPLGSRIMCVADVFAALTEDRPYRKNMDHKSAIPIMQNMVDNDHLDGNIVKVLFGDFEEIVATCIAVQKPHAEDYVNLIGKTPSN